MHFCVTIALQAPKGVKERVKSPYRITSRIARARISPHITHVRIAFTEIFNSAKYNRTERLLHLFDGSGLLRNFTIALHALLCLQDATIRPVLKHGPRSSTGLRVVEFISHNAHTAKRKQTRTM